MATSTGATKSRPTVRPRRANVLADGVEKPITSGTLLFVSGNLRQDRRLDRFLFLFFFRLIDWLSGRIHQSRGHEDNEIPFNMLIDVGAKQTPDHRNVTEERRPVFDF